MSRSASVAEDSPTEQSRSTDDLNSGEMIWVAAPFALVVVFFLARSLPIHFEAPPNPLGIVSWSTRNGYAPVQEVFWYGFALAVGTVVAWGITRILVEFHLSEKRRVVAEVVAGLPLIGIVFLPASLAGALAFSSAVVVGILLTGSSAFETALGAGTGDAAVRRWQLRGLPFALSAVAVALLLAPSFWQSLVDVVRATPDEIFASSDWSFQAELGQNLAWADDILHGQAPGRDFFMLYGPLYPLGAVGVWKLLGRSIAAWWLYHASLNVLALLATMALAVRLVARRGLCLALPFLLLPLVIPGAGALDLRYGIGIGGLACLVRAFERNAAAWATAAGAVAGAGLFFSQEFALAFLLSAAVGLSIRARWRETMGFVGGFIAGGAPCVAWLFWVGALMPMLRDLVGYPEWVMAGFGKVPFWPVSSFPIPIAGFHSWPAVGLRLAYSTPAVCWAALLWAGRIDRADLRRPLSSLRALRSELVAQPLRLGIAILALFGLLAFRSALARSQPGVVIKVCGAASILLCIGIDRALDTRRRTRILAAWRVAALAGVALIGGFTGKAASLAGAALTSTAKVAVGSVQRPTEVEAQEEVLGVLEWIREHTDSADQVLFLPNHAAYYYLTDRRSPIRFVLGHQMVTNAHRSEALAKLSSVPPRFIVFAPHSWAVDEIPHAAYLGPSITSWITENYLQTARVGTVLIFERRPTMSRASPVSPDGRTTP